MLVRCGRVWLWCLRVDLGDLWSALVLQWYGSLLDMRLHSLVRRDRIYAMVQVVEVWFLSWGRGCRGSDWVAWDVLLVRLEAALGVDGVGLVLSKCVILLACWCLWCMLDHGSGRTCGWGSHQMIKTSISDPAYVWLPLVGKFTRFATMTSTKVNIKLTNHC